MEFKKDIARNVQESHSTITVLFFHIEMANVATSISSSDECCLQASFCGALQKLFLLFVCTKNLIVVDCLLFLT